MLPFKKLPGSDAVLGPEMRSTGEVMGHAARFGHAFAKAQLAAGVGLPLEGAVLISVNDFDKGAALKIARDLNRHGLSPHGHARAPPTRCAAPACRCRRSTRCRKARPHVVDLIRAGQVELILNTPLGPARPDRRPADPPGGHGHGRAAADHAVAAAAAVAAIRALREKDFRYRSLQAHFGVR